MLASDSPWRYYSPFPCYREPSQHFPFQLPEEGQNLLAENCFGTPGFMTKVYQVGKIWMAYSAWSWETQYLKKHLRYATVQNS